MAVLSHIPVLDGWRGFAVLIVVFHNTGYIMEVDGSLLSKLVSIALVSGWVGVTLFFVLSGFLITGILLNTVGSPGFFRSFYARRTLRIFPLYYGFLTFVLLILPRLVDISGWITGLGSDQVWYWLYLSNWSPLLSGDGRGLGHLWSLAVEEQFYLLWPLLLYVIGSRRFAKFAAMLVAATVLLRFAMYRAELPTQYLYTFTIARSDSLAIGAILAVMARQTEPRAAFDRIAKPLSIATLIGLGAIVIETHGFQPHDPTVLLAGQTLIAILFGLAMLITMERRTPTARRLHSAISATWLRTLGKYSYAVYIFHAPIHTVLSSKLSLFINAGGSLSRVTLTLTYCLLILAISTVLAYASWHLYEKHFIALKEVLAPRPAPSRSV